MTETSTFNLFQNERNTRHYRAGSVIFSADDVGDSFYVIREGTVALTADGRELEQVGPGGIFGELALLDQAPRSANAIALTDCEVIPIDERRFMYLVGQTPFFALTVMRVMSGRLRRASGTPTYDGPRA